MIKITVPPHEDSISGITLNNERFEIRFTYNFESDYWTYGLFDVDNEVIYQGIKIVPNYILNPIGNFPDAPQGIFYCTSVHDSVKRDDFINDRAQFIFLTGDEFAELAG